MCLKRLSRFAGRIVGRASELTLRGFFKGLFYVCIGLFLLLGIILAFLGNVIVVFLTFISTVCLYFLKGFSWLTEHLFLTTKWSGQKVGDYTDAFFDGIADVFQKENEKVEKEIKSVIQIDN